MIKKYLELCVTLAVVACVLTTAMFLLACNSIPGASSRRGSSSSGEASFEGVVTMKEQTGSGAIKQQKTEIYYMKGSKIRIESLDSNASGEPKTIVLEDTDSGKMVGLFPSRKQYMSMNFGALVDDSMVEGSTVARTGQKDTIAGQPCEYWHWSIVGEDAESGDVCITKGLGNLVTGMAKLFGPKTRAKMESNPNWKQFFSGGCFPMKQTIVDKDGSLILSSEVVNIERKRLDDGLFVMPAGYTQMNTGQ